MRITYPEVQIEGTSQEICAVLQCLMLNVAAGSLRDEMDRVAKAMFRQNEDWKPTYEEMERIMKSEESEPEPEPEQEAEPEPEPESEPEPVPRPVKKKHVPTGEKAPKPVELRKDGGIWTRYESKREAAEAIGVRGTDVSRAVKTGWLVNGYEARAAGKEKVQPKRGYSTCGKPRKVDVKVADDWLTFDSLTDAAKFIGCGANNLQTGMAKGHYKGFEVRYHVDDSGKENPELDNCLAEIEAANKRPYEVSRRI